MEITTEAGKLSVTRLRPILNKDKLAEKSIRTCTRIDEIKLELRCYYESINKLHAFAKGNINLKGKGYSPSVERYKRTLEDKKRFYWTMQNLEQQIALLENELVILMEYGA